MYCFALSVVLIGYCAVNSMCCAHDFCATPVLCRPTCSSTTPCTATGSTVTSNSRTPRPFSSVRSRSPSSASGSPCYCFIQRSVTASFRDRLSFLFMLWPDVWAATILKEPGGDPVGWGWRWLCCGVHWCLHWQGEGCCSLEGIGAAWSSYGCYRMFVLRLFVMFMFSLVSECMHLGEFIYLQGWQIRWPT